MYAHGAFVDDVGIEVEVFLGGIGSFEVDALHLLADCDFVPVESALRAVGRTLDDFSHRTTASDAVALTVSLLNQSHHLGAGGEDEVRVLGGW